MRFTMLLAILGSFLSVLCVAAMLVYSFKRCGWGAFAYENAFIAALTQECAQQQRELFLNEQLKAAQPAQ